MDAQGNRIVALSDETVENVKKLRIQFTDNTITPLIYNISYIQGRILLHIKYLRYRYTLILKIMW